MLSKDAVQGSSTERVAVKDLNLVYRACTSSFAELLGLESPALVIGHTDFDLFPAAIAQQQVLLDQRSIASAEADISSITLAGQAHQQLVLRTPILSASNAVRGLDIRMLVGPASRATVTTPHEAAAQPATALQGNLVFRRGRPLFANPAAATLLGFADTAELLHRESVASLFEPQAWQRLVRNVVERKRTALPHDRPREFELQAIGADDRKFTLLASTSDIRWQGQEAVLLAFVPVGAQSLIGDIGDIDDTCDGQAAPADQAAVTAAEVSPDLPIHPQHLEGTDGGVNAEYVPGAAGGAPHHHAEPVPPTTTRSTAPPRAPTGRFRGRVGRNLSVYLPGAAPRASAASESAAARHGPATRLTRLQRSINSDTATETAAASAADTDTTAITTDTAADATTVSSGTRASVDAQGDSATSNPNARLLTPLAAAGVGAVAAAQPPLRSENDAESGAGSAREPVLARDELSQQGQRYRDYAHAAADFFWETDADLRFSMLSDEVISALGVEPDDVLGKTHADLTQTIEPYNDDDTWQGHLTRIEEHQPFRDFEFKWSVANEIKTIRYSGIPVYSPENAFCGYRGTATDVTTANRVAESVAYHASHDALTGLVNRREFEARVGKALERARVERRSHALCFMDLDSFKIVNDTCGHLAGDELLRQLASLLDSLVRKSDVLARLGGDEFGLFLYNCNVAAALKLANQIRSEVENFEFLWEGNRFMVGVSVGVVVVDDRWENLEAVFHAADSACYIAKDGGRNQVVVYREADGNTSNRQVETHWVEEINQALDSSRISIAVQRVQPLIGADTGLYLEVLMRLHRPDGEVVNPRAFLPSAERYGLSARLDLQVVRLTLDYLTRHPHDYNRTRMCAINLASGSFASEEFAAELLQLLQESDVAPEKLAFELTETATIANLSTASQFIRQFHALGCRFIIDDFGSGLSAFNYLKNLPVDFLKIDGRLVRDIIDDPTDYTMVKAINEVGHSLGKRTIAEFVENQHVLSAVREIGVDFAQGFEIGYPELVELT